MSWCPFATRMELQPESDSQQAIVPDQFIVHSLAAPWTARRTFEYWRDSTTLESHYGLGYAGDLGQYIGTQTRADANAAANRRANGHGAVSLESASNKEATDPWTDAQVDVIVDLGIWLHEEHAIPLRICRTWDDPGYGYHRLFDAWNPSAHSCPGPVRVEQFRDLVFPRIKNGEGSMAAVDLTDAALDAVALRVANKLIAGGGVLEASDIANVATAVTTRMTATGGVLDVVRAQATANGTSLSTVHAKLDALKLLLDDLDLSGLPEDVAAKLNGLRFVLQEGV
jgi:hypothetical protein